MEYEIGKIVNIGFVQTIVTKADSCEHCFFVELCSLEDSEDRFHFTTSDITGECNSKVRTDKENIIFKII